MADDHATHVTELSSPKSSPAEIDAGLRHFLLSVYNYMGSGLVLTGLVSYGAAETGLYARLVKTPALFFNELLDLLLAIADPGLALTDVARALLQFRLASFQGIARAVELSLSVEHSLFFALDVTATLAQFALE